MNKWIGLWACCFLAGCVGVPKDVTPVSGFELERYLGKWYEIARLDHSFERGLTQVTATYSMREDGGVAVLNQGFSAEEDGWQSAEGKAYFVDSNQTGHLKVSFFGPFYASYVVFALDKESYEYAFVSGPDKDFLWLLSRSPQVSPELRARFESQAQSLGFDTGELIWVEQKPD